MKTITFAFLLSAMSLASAMPGLATEHQSGGAANTRDAYYEGYVAATRLCEPYLDERHEWEQCLESYGY